MTGIGLIGFGRVGRRLFREICTRPGLMVNAVSEINPSGREPAELSANLAYLLAHDTIAGPFPGRVEAAPDALLVQDRRIPLFFDTPPEQIDWAGLGVRILVEASGADESLAGSAPLAGEVVDKVVITRASSRAQVTLVRGVNLGDYDPARHHIVSCSTCTANAAAPVLKLLHENYGVERASLTTVHPALSGDTFMDRPCGDAAAGRSGLTVRPVPSQVARTTAQVLPELKGRLVSMSLRVPTLVVNALLADVLLDHPPQDTSQVLELLDRAAEERLAGVLAVERGFGGLSRVAADFAGDPHSAVVDANWLALEGPLLRLLIWHDNEYAYCLRVADTLETIAAALG